MKRTLCALSIILTAGCSNATAPSPAGLRSLTGEWYASSYAPDIGLEWSLSLTELSTGHVTGTVTLTSSGAFPTPTVSVRTGSVAGEHRGIDVVLTFLYEDGHQVSFEGQQVEADIFRVEGEGGGLHFVRVDP